MGAQVTTEVLATDRDSFFPLQAALGYDIAQNLFVGADDLLVEGNSAVTVAGYARTPTTDDDYPFPEQSGAIGR